MKFGVKQEDDVQINLTPLIDVVFLLLIFFMVTTTFSKESQLRIKLPEASTEKPAEEANNVIRVEISRDGQYAVKAPRDDTAFALVNRDLNTLRRALQQASTGVTDPQIVIRADKSATHESVIKAMDVARRMGILNITFATQYSLSESANQ